jgi:pilus assembly protein CpaC
VPIPLAGAFGTQTVEFKPYGIIFNIEPVIGANDVIMAKISTELSQIDPAVSVGGIPGFLTRMTSTEISVRPGEMVALSGLVNSELSNAIDKVPGLGNVPVLGRLFRSDDFRNKRTDLVVLLEPEIVASGEGMADRLRQRGVDGTKEFEDKVRDSIKPVFAPARGPADSSTKQ